MLDTRTTARYTVGMDFDYTWFRTFNSAQTWVRKSGPLTEMFPPHIVAPRKESVPCVGDYLLTGKRGNENVASKTMLILDVDCDPKAEGEFDAWWESLCSASACLEASGIEHLVASSHNHGKVKKGPFPYFGFRLVIPFSDPISPENSRNINTDFRNLAKALIAKFKLPGNLMALSQPWYQPSVPDEDGLARAVYEYFPGEPLNPAAFKYEKAVKAKPVVTESDYTPNVSDVHRKTPLALRVAMLQTNWSPRLNAAVGYVLANEVPELEGGKSRHSEVLLPATIAIARSMTEDETVDDAIEVMRPWLEKMQAADPRTSGWESEARRALDGAIAKLPQWRAEHRARVEAECDQFTGRTQ